MHVNAERANGAWLESQDILIVERLVRHEEAAINNPGSFARSRRFSHVDIR
jgi:hypothetical protein